LKQIWANDSKIEEVTFRQLLTMNSGVKDYYYDSTNWLYKEVMGSKRDVEPLEYLVHMDKAFLFSPGETIIVPEGKPGAGMKVKRGSYSTNGFSLIGLALAGVLNVTDWADVDQLSLAWGASLPSDDGTLFPTRGTCLSYDQVCHQYTSEDEGQAFTDITGHSCLNSWLGGNIAPRPLDVARFSYNAFATENLIDEAHQKEMLALHPMTDGFAAWGMAYGLGLEAEWGNKGGKPQEYCTYQGLGHGGLDYGSGANMNGYFPQMKLGLSLGMTSGVRYGSGVAGMACDRSWDSLGRAYEMAMNEVLNTVAEYAGLKPTCSKINYNKLPVDECKDAPSFGSLGGHPLTCAEAMPLFTKDGQHTAGQLCGWFETVTVSSFAEQIGSKANYTPPKGVNPETTLVSDLCRGTCMAAGAGPCWLSGPTTPWCSNTTDSRSKIHAVHAQEKNSTGTGAIMIMHGPRFAPWAVLARPNQGFHDHGADLGPLSHPN